MKKAFQLAYALNLAGTETVFMNWYRHIDRSQLQFDFGVQQVYHTPLVGEIGQLGGRIFIIPAGHGFYKRLRLLVCLYKTLKRYGPYDVFQSHDHFFAGLTCMAAWLAGVPKRITISHFADGAGRIGWPQKIHRAFSRWFIARFSTQRLAVSRQAGETLYGEKMSFRIIKNGIDCKKFAYNPALRAQLRQQLGLADNLVIGHIGRFAKEKNQLFLIQAFAQIYKKNSNARLVLIGEGPLENQVRQEVACLGLERVVRLVGRQAHIENWYQVFDIFVLPSLFEGFGLVALEAQCSGLPCVATNTLSREVQIGKVLFLPLDKGTDFWAEQILRQKIEGRQDGSEEIRKAGFDVTKVGQFIEQEYLK